MKRASSAVFRRIQSHVRRQSLATLAVRYFSSHGPATVQDFAWWSGLPVAVARKALNTAQSLVRVETDGKVFWAAQEPPSLPMPQTAYLLPPYDDYLLGYKDRSWALALADVKQVNAGGGMPKPTIVVRGKVAGTWRRTVNRNQMIVALELFRSLDETERKAVEHAALRYGEFNAIPTKALWLDAI